MPLEAVNTAPSLDSYTPLSEHEAQTPRTFFGARAVLHAHVKDCKVLIAREDVDAHDPLRGLWTSSGRADLPESSLAHQDARDSVSSMLTIAPVDVLVASEYDSLLL